MTSNKFYEMARVSKEEERERERERERGRETEGKD